MDKIQKSHLVQRQSLGILGVILPILVVLFGLFNHSIDQWYYSISASFYTSAAPIFIGIMVSVGIFLITYQGYSILDKVINIISGVLAIFIIIFPCNATTSLNVGLFNLPVAVSNIIHVTSAILFFIVLACNIGFLFTKSGGEITKEKKTRNKIYISCASSMGGVMILFVIASLLHFNGPVTLIFEAILLLLFGIAWLVKGEAIKKLNDK